MYIYILITGQYWLLPSIVWLAMIMFLFFTFSLRFFFSNLWCSWSGASHKLSISQFNNRNHAKICSLIIHTFHTQISCIESIFETHIYWKMWNLWHLFIHRFVFHPSTHLFVCQSYVQRIIFMSKMYEPMNQRTLHNFNY